MPRLPLIRIYLLFNREIFVSPLPVCRLLERVPRMRAEEKKNCYIDFIFFPHYSRYIFLFTIIIVTATTTAKELCCGSIVGIFVRNMTQQNKKYSHRMKNVINVKGDVD